MTNVLCSYLMDILVRNIRLMQMISGSCINGSHKAAAVVASLRQRPADQHECYRSDCCRGDEVLAAPMDVAMKNFDCVNKF